MKKALLFLAGVAVCSLGFASAPRVNNHGFVLENQVKATVVEEQAAQVEEVVVATEAVVVKENTAAKQTVAKKISKAEKKALRQEVKKAVKELKNSNISKEEIQNIPAVKEMKESGNAAQADQILLVILAIFIPFLAVLLNNGAGKEFIIDLILTILGWLPGVIYALWLLLA